MKSTNSDWAGVIVGLPESPVVDIELKNIEHSGEEGVPGGVCDGGDEHVKIVSEDGKPMTMGAEGKVTGSYAKK